VSDIMRRGVFPRCPSPRALPLLPVSPLAPLRLTPLARCSPSLAIHATQGDPSRSPAFHPLGSILGAPIPGASSSPLRQSLRSARARAWVPRVLPSRPMPTPRIPARFSSRPRPSGLPLTPAPPPGSPPGVVAVPFPPRGRDLPRGRWQLVRRPLARGPPDPGALPHGAPRRSPAGQGHTGGRGDRARCHRPRRVPQPAPGGKRGPGRLRWGFPLPTGARGSLPITGSLLGV